MVNSSNMVVSTGKMVSDVKIFDNKDGSKKVRFSVAASDNFKNSKGERGTQFVPYEAFIAKGAELGVYDRMHQGDLVTVMGSVKNNNYKDASGNDVFGIILAVESVALLESKAVTDARQARRIASDAVAEEAVAE